MPEGPERARLTRRSASCAVRAAPRGRCLRPGPERACSAEGRWTTEGREGRRRQRGAGAPRRRRRRHPHRVPGPDRGRAGRTAPRPCAPPAATTRSTRTPWSGWPSPAAARRSRSGPAGPDGHRLRHGDVSAVAKALRDFARTNPNLVVKGGLRRRPGCSPPRTSACWPTCRPATSCWPSWPAPSPRRCSSWPACSQALPRTWPTGCRPCSTSAARPAAEVLRRRPPPSRPRPPTADRRRRRRPSADRQPRPPTTGEPTTAEAATAEADAAAAEARRPRPRPSRRRPPAEPPPESPADAGRPRHRHRAVDHRFNRDRPSNDQGTQGATPWQAP